MSQLAEKTTFKQIEVEGYEKVLEVKNEEAGLHAIIAIHNTEQGPAVGGTRVVPYATFEEGLTDALRLSRGMTYKAGVSETGTGGGKSVIFFDSKKPKPEALLLAFGEAVNTLGGEYVCAEDVGMTLEDLLVVRRVTPYVVGIPHKGSCGDPSRFTARGVYRGIQSVCRKLWDTHTVRGRTIAIQGLGAVGYKLAEHLFWGGAHLIVADINDELAARAKRDFGADVVSVDEILSVECDILAPCALGGILNSKTIPELKCRAVAGATNNQLLTDEDGRRLVERNILYAPDYVINSAGLLTVCVELEPEGYNAEVARCKTDRIYDILFSIFTIAEEKQQQTHEIADRLAMDNIKRGIGKRTQDPVFHT